MSTFDILPGESNAHVISSIINLVCPQCGGRMSEFQCEGRCRRNWLADGMGKSRDETLSPVSRAIAPGRCDDLACDHVRNLGSLDMLRFHTSATPSIAGGSCFLSCGSSGLSSTS